ncbi:Fic family protein [Hydrogenimonas sp.]
MMQAYIPDKLPLENLDLKRLFPLATEANTELARYDGLLSGIVNAEIMLSPLTNEEAVLSSRIEGTQATVDEVLEHEAGMRKEGEKEKDIQEIVNYRKALYEADNFLRDGALSLALVRYLHKILLDSVRGYNKNPGEFRKDQNWIGPQGCTIEEATFVPPSPLRMMDDLLAWETYIQGRDIDVLVQCAVMHAQFELIHPFKDGNGRIGRILIPLFLFYKRKLGRPMFYLSSYLEKHRDEYYGALRNISEKGAWDDWIAFFLEAVIEQSKTNAKRVKTIMTLYDDMKERVQAITHSQYTIQVIDTLFDRPIFKTTDFITRTGIHKPTAMGLLRQLREAGILTPIKEARGRSAAILAFPELINIAEGKDVF